MKRNGKGYGLIADQDIKKDEFIIKYMGKIVNDDPMNEYSMKYKGLNLWINSSRTDTLAKYMNHSCIPNCINKMWAIKGLPLLCFFEKENIKQKDELTFGYQWSLKVKGNSELEKKGTKCNCGSVNCCKNIKKPIYTMKKRKRG